jgi:hypothetical protein
MPGCLVSMSCQETIHADVLIEVGPVQPFSRRADTKALPLFWRGMQQRGKPCERHGQLSAIGQAYRERIAVEMKVEGTCAHAVKRESAAGTGYRNGRVMTRLPRLTEGSAFR